MFRVMNTNAIPVIAVIANISETVTNNSVEECVHQIFPTYWTKEQWTQKLNKNKWLIIQTGKLGCKICHEVGTDHSQNGELVQGI
jgi:hypothetical protein